ncbi:hypothetical protein EW146_g5797 [Bondarzewia mesenterica]|uniref:Uncharacterized protein n=1 Tax=Bondarzewia mesenterica TaxID=1095465 RepID=A0A4S4LS90_9AGAM|nr:hypothetical protein EW146_g5797 [Bondarzewia mesenterica]
MAIKIKCFYQFYLGFIKGVAQVDEEVIETLWAPLNQISGSTQTMATSHREEAFAKLTSATDTRLLTKWSQQEGAAAASHQTNPEWLDIYNISKTKMPGKAAYQLQLTEAERENVPGVLRGMVAWLATGIKIQEAQIATFNQEAIHYVGEIKQTEEWEDIPGNEIQDPMSNNEDDADAAPGPADNVSKNADEEDVVESVVAKKICLSLPSTFSKDKCMELGLQALAKQELELRKADLGTDDDLLSIYKDLDPKDLKVSMAISDLRKPGHRKESLAWFWNMDVQRDAEQRGWMEECEVHWLQAKALRNQWEEQVTLLAEEMWWSVKAFKTKANFWASLIESVDVTEHPGHHAYAAQQ